MDSGDLVGTRRAELGRHDQLQLHAAVAGSTLLRSTGNGSWSVAYSAPVMLTSVWGSGPTDVWVGGASGKLYRGSGTGWTPVTTGTTMAIKQVFGSGPTDVSAVATDGSGTDVINCNGTACSKLPPTSSTGLGGAGPRNDLWITGQDRWMHWNGSAWTEAFPRGLAKPVGGSTIQWLPTGELFATAQNGPFYFDGREWTQHQLHVPPSINNFSALDYSPVAMRLGDQNRAVASQLKMCGRPLCWEYTRDKLTSATPDAAAQARFRRFAQAQVDMSNRIFQGTGLQFHLSEVRYEPRGLPVYQLGYGDGVETFITFLDGINAEDRAANWRVNVFYHEALPGGALGMSKFATAADFADKYGLHVSLASGEYTLAHELGHFFGLDHIFETRDPVTGAHTRGEERISRDAATRGAADCLTTGDRICDTWADPQGLTVPLGVFRDDGTTRATVSVQLGCGFSECDSDAEGHFANRSWRAISLSGRTLSDALGDVGDRYVRDYCFEDAGTLRVNTCAQPVRCPATPVSSCAEADPTIKLNLGGIEYAGCKRWASNVCSGATNQNPEDPANRYQCGYTNLPPEQLGAESPVPGYGWLTSIPPDELARRQLEQLALERGYTSPVSLGEHARTHAYLPPLGIGIDNLMSYGDSYATMANIASFAPRKGLSPTQRRLVQLIGRSGVRGHLASVDADSIAAGAASCTASVRVDGPSVEVAFVRIEAPVAGWQATVTAPFAPHASSAVAIEVTPLGPSPQGSSVAIQKLAAPADSYLLFTTDDPAGASVIVTPFVLLRGSCTSAAAGTVIEQSTSQTERACDDGNPCTRDHLDEAGACAHDAEADGTTCDDGLYCNGGATCAAGACAPGPAPDCRLLDSACGTGVCDEAARACNAAPRATGAACDDGDACTTGDVCTVAGVCAGAARCDDGNPGTTDSCTPTTGACTNTPVAGASYDATLKVLRCVSNTSPCSTPAGTISPRLGEPNAPNTLHGQCADGAYNANASVISSIDSISVTSASGAFTPGGSATVTVTATCYGTKDVVDLWYAPSLSTSAMTRVGGLNCPGSGSRSFTFNVALPAGSTGDHVVRAQYRFAYIAGCKISVANCPTTSCAKADDHDDLVFAVR